MGKKKPSLKPVKRGVTTASVPSKKPETEPAPAAEQAISSGPVVSEVEQTPDPAQDESAPDSWESPETTELEDLVSRLQPKGEKEAGRINKSIETERRMSQSLPLLELPPLIVDRILSMALEDDDQGGVETADDQELLQHFVAYKVLAWMRFPADTVWDCISHLHGDWQEGLAWMLLRGHEPLRDAMGLGYGETSERPPRLLESSHALEGVKQEAKIPKTVATSKEPETVKPLFRSIEDEDSSDDEDGPIDVNEQWAQKMVQVQGSGVGSGRNGNRKPKPSDVAQLKELENDYLFDKKRADALFKALMTQRNARALEDRMRGLTSSDPPSTASPTPDETPEGGTSNTSDIEDDLLGNLLDLPEEPGLKLDASNTTVQLISMPIPSNFTGMLPKALLQTSVSRSLAEAVITYAKLSGHSRAVRFGLEVCWTTQDWCVWRMEDIACATVLEAENYVATLALHELMQKGLLNQVNWRGMPASFRDLWDELETQASQTRHEANIKLWERLRTVVQEKIRIIPPTTKPTTTVSIPEERAPIKAAIAGTRLSFQSRQASPAYQAMKKHRDQLPIAAFREEILQAIETSQVVVLSGETGCGKSTQLPAFILEDFLVKDQNCKIVVTEPRRISAISLAQRVALELGDKPGSVEARKSIVSYAVRLENTISATTQLAYVTNGIALRMLEGGTSNLNLDSVTHIIVDEVHERSIESDFLLIVLKGLLRRRPDLKVILMSATLDSAKLSDYFDGCPTLSVPGRTFPVDVYHLEDAIELTGWQVDTTSTFGRQRAARKEVELTPRESPESTDDENDDPAKLSASKFSAQTISAINSLDHRRIPYELIVRLLEDICFSDTLTEYSAAILVFMPGLAEIRTLNDLLQSHTRFGTRDFIVYPLHSTISSEGQSAVFNVPPRGMRKIVISTNIAETGITIPDITCVIDTGRHREMRYDEKRHLSRLVETYISKSNAKQRRGRAGRVRPGIAFHLFTKARHDAKLLDNPIPEMLRLSLQDLALRIKLLDLKLGSSIQDVFDKALDPPSRINVQRAIAALIDVKALTSSESITPLGVLLSRLPMDVHMGKFLLVASIFRCLHAALTIVALLEGKSPFLTSWDDKGSSHAVKAAFAKGDSDFLTLVNVFDKWREVTRKSTGDGRAFCQRFSLSFQNLQHAEETRQQILTYLADSEFILMSALERQRLGNARQQRSRLVDFVDVPAQYNDMGQDERITGAALALGFYPNLLIRGPDRSLRTVSNDRVVSIHPSSVVSAVSLNANVRYLVFSSLIQLRKLYASEVGPVREKAVALLCGDQFDARPASSSLQVDRKIRYRIDPRSALALQFLRVRLDDALEARFEARPWSQSQQASFDLVLSYLQSEADL